MREDEREVVLAIGVSQTTGQLQRDLIAEVCESGSFTGIQLHIPKKTIPLAREYYARAFDLGLELWPLTSSIYPELLREISVPPALLYVRRAGNGGKVRSSALSVVGRRAATLYVCQEATRLSAQLAGAGITVVSGLALGIDAAAHRGALLTSLECPTIAVLAHGLDVVYPPSHVGLAKQIVDSGGVLISEYPPGVQPRKHHFLARNRIIAGLSRGVVVVEAAARSGSLVTAQCAADYGRDVFVIRGGEDAESSAGGEELIAQGAISISAARDILAEYGLDSPSDVAACEEWRSESVESFMRGRGVSQSDLLNLELRGHVERLPGNRIRYRAGA